MKINELRFGSYVFLFGRPAKIAGVFKSTEELPVKTFFSSGKMIGDVVMFENGDTAVLGGVVADVIVKPVKITPEILKKAHFKEYDDINKRWNLEGIEYYDETAWFGTSEIEVKYLHQLQNLIFALTGEELEINL